jgi:hypothetical protein
MFHGTTILSVRRNNKEILFLNVKNAIAHTDIFGCLTREGFSKTKN